MKKWVEDQLTEVIGLDVELKNHENRVTSLMANLEGKETVLQERDEHLRLRGVELKEKDAELISRHRNHPQRR